MAALNVIGSLSSIRTTPSTRRTCPRQPTTRISCVGWVQTPNSFNSPPISASTASVAQLPDIFHDHGKDPEGILGPPHSGHIARLEFKRRLEKDADARETFQKQVRDEQERKRKLRESRVIPETNEGLVEYFLDTEAGELEYEIARLRPRLTKEFFGHLQFEVGELRFAVTRTKDMEDRLIELEAMQKVLQEGTEAYEKMQADLVLAKERLAKIFQAKDIKATLLEMVERNEINRPLLTVLDENIASAQRSDQKQAAEFMEKIRSAILRYMTV